MNPSEQPTDHNDLSDATREETIAPPDYNDTDKFTKPTKPKRRTPAQIESDKRELNLGFYEKAQRLQIEFQEAELEAIKLQNTNQALENYRFRLDLLLRVIATIIIPGIVILWLIEVLHIVTTQQSKIPGEGLPETTMIALLGTTTITVLGMMGIVVRYLFTKPIAQTTIYPRQSESADY